MSKLITISKFNILFFKVSAYVFLTLIVPGTLSIISLLQCLACLNTFIFHSVCGMSDVSSAKNDCFLWSHFFFDHCLIDSNKKCLCHVLLNSRTFPHAIIRLLPNCVANSILIFFINSIVSKKASIARTYLFIFGHEMALRIKPIKNFLK